MDTSYRGILHVRSANTGSRSEGRYACLADDAGVERKLCRQAAAPFDDPFFDSFDGRRVEIGGAIRHDWLVVERIEPAEEEEAPAEDPTADAQHPDAKPEKS